MKITRRSAVQLASLALGLTVSVPSAYAQAPHVLVPADKVQWSSAPPALPAGAQISVLEGNPAEKGPVTLRLKFPANFVIAPHWHTTDEIITVLAGTLHAGMGDQLDREKSLAFPTGAFVVMPAKHHHFAWTQEETIVEIHANNPFDIVYVNPADDPRKR